jgi:peptide/nickel transport system substrate-binding protein
VQPTFTEWLVFTEQFDPKSPWHDRRVRLGTSLAIDRKAINEADYLGYGRVSSSIIPQDLPFHWVAPAYPYDPAQAKKLLAEAGFPRGFDAVEIAGDAVYAQTIEAVVNSLQAVGIRAKVWPVERAAFYTASRQRRWTRSAARRPSTRSSSSCTSAPCSGRSSRPRSSAGTGRAWRSPASR